MGGSDNLIEAAGSAIGLIFVALLCAEVGARLRAGIDALFDARAGEVFPGDAAPPSPPEDLQ